MKLALKMKKTISIPALALVLTLAFLFRPGDGAAPDAISSASLTVATGTLTATTAVVNYSRDRYSNGTRTLCFDPAPAAPTHNCTARQASGNSGSFTLSKLTPATLYNYKITASDGRHSNYSTSGTFKTLATTGIAAERAVRRPAIPGLGSARDLRGRAVTRGKGLSREEFARPAR
jgi:hypothetical protein